MNTPLPIGFLEVDIERLVKADWNYKLDDAELADKLEANIKRNGQIENIIIRQLPSGFYEVVNGNHRFDVMKRTGLTRVMAYNLGPVSLQQAQRVAIETNETRFSSDPDRLAKIIEELQVEFNLDDLTLSLPYSETELEAMLAGLNVLLPSSTVDVTEDEFQTIVPPVAQPGDVYELGPHRLVCGDSTSEEDVSTLMAGHKACLLFTDPPYNIAYNSLNAKRDGGKDWQAANNTAWTDSMSDEDYDSFLEKFLMQAKRSLIDHAHYYVWYASQYHSMLTKALESVGIPYDKVPIIWKKNSAPITYARYKRLYEPCIYGGLGATNGAGHDARWFGNNSETNIWEISRENVLTYVHPTQKPIALIARALHNSTQPGEIVLDLFGGSGSTLVACEQMQRICYTMEKEPHYVDVIVQRYIDARKREGKPAVVRRNGELMVGSSDA